MIKIFKKIKSRTLLLTMPAIAIAIIFTFVPFFKTIENSFSVHSNIYDYNESSFGTNNFASLIRDPIFIVAIKNTSFLFFIVAPIALVIFFMISVLINSISNKIFKNSIVSLMFSQFFISSYAIGMSFMVLFSNDNNVLNTIFGTNTPFASQRNHTGVLLSISIFFIWRISAISMVLFIFSFSKINQKLFLVGKIDRIKFWKKIQIIYLPNIKNTFYLIIYIYMFEALFLYPTIFKNATIVKGQTIMYYIIEKFNSSNYIEWSIGAAASIILFAYSLLIILIIVLSKKIYLKKYRKKSYA